MLSERNLCKSDSLPAGNAFLCCVRQGRYQEIQLDLLSRLAAIVTFPLGVLLSHQSGSGDPFSLSSWVQPLPLSG